MASKELYIDFATHPERYKHWKLCLQGRIARLAMDVQEDAPLVPGYELKLNSYDLGVDIELYRCRAAFAFRAPRGGGGGYYVGEAAGVLCRGEYSYAGPVFACP